MKKLFFLSLLAFSTIGAMDNKTSFYLASVHDHVKKAYSARNLCCGPQVLEYARTNICKAVNIMNKVHFKTDEIVWVKSELEYLATHFYALGSDKVYKRLWLVDYEIEMMWSESNSQSLE